MERRKPDPHLADESVNGGCIHTTVFVLSYDEPGAIGSRQQGLPSIAPNLLHARH